MTTKRFESRQSINKTGYVVIDNEKQYTFPVMSEDDCYIFCKVLNALHEENTRLKRQICNLEHTRDFCAECCERLEKENEQLKSEIREVRGEYEQLWMRL